MGFNINKIEIVDNYDYNLELIKQLKEHKEQINMGTFLKDIEKISISLRVWLRQYDAYLSNFNEIRSLNYNRYYLVDVLNQPQKNQERYANNNSFISEALKVYKIREQLLLKHVAAGYIILDKLREALTGQEILFGIMLGSGSQLAEIEVSLEELFQYGHISLSHNYDDKVRQGIDKTYKDISSVGLQLDNLISELQKARKKEKIKSKALGKENSKLYNKLLELFLNTKASKDRKEEEKYANRGHIYEMYYYLTRNAKNPFKDTGSYHWNKWTDKTTKIGIFIEAVRASAFNSTPSIEGGDTGYYDENGKLISIQLKNITASSAQLMNSSSMATWIEEIADTLEKNNIKDMQDALIELFTQKENKDDVNYKLAKASNEEIRKGIEQTFSFLNS